jgi:very-short-patch-repair endonuclease
VGRSLAEKGIVVLRFTRTAILQRPYEVVALLAQAISRQMQASSGQA